MRRKGVDGLQRSRVAIVALFASSLFVALSASSCEQRLSGPICAQADQPRRVVVDTGMTGDFLCIPTAAQVPPGFREFPGGTPFYNSDPRWREYVKQYADSTNSPLSSP